MLKGMIRRVWLAFVGLLLTTQAFAHPVVVTSSPRFVPPPPPRPMVAQPLRPSPAWVWIEGQWTWTGYQWAWSPGYWAAAAPQPYVGPPMRPGYAVAPPPVYGPPPRPPGQHVIYTR